MMIEFYDNIVNLLDEDELSPFFHEIDHNINQFSKNGRVNEVDGCEIQFFSKGAIQKTIQKIIKEKAFFFISNPETKEEIEINLEIIIDMMIDYFNAIKCVFHEIWVQKKSLIRRNVGIYAWGNLISIIWTGCLNSLKREVRVKKLINEFAAWRSLELSLDLTENSTYSKQMHSESLKNANWLYHVLLKNYLRFNQNRALNEKFKKISQNSIRIWEDIKTRAEKLRKEGSFQC